jgi:hypothetical protein
VITRWFSTWQIVLDLRNSEIQEPIDMIRRSAAACLLVVIWRFRWEE